VVSYGFWCINWRPLKELLNDDVVLEGDVAQHCLRYGLSLSANNITLANDAMEHLCDEACGLSW